MTEKGKADFVRDGYSVQIMGDGRWFVSSHNRNLGFPPPFATSEQLLTWLTEAHAAFDKEAAR
jgi:hypothetical protein